MGQVSGVTVVEVDQLTKRYGNSLAVNEASFTVASGEIFGLLGHNGAGKSTIIRILSGRARASSGRARVAGFDVATQMEHIRPLINVVFEDQNHYERMTGRDQLRFFAAMYGTPTRVADRLLNRVGLSTAAAGRLVATYSTGMKQRLLLARALINRPSIVFLDEPTRGLDPVSVRNLRTIIAELAQDGTTLFLTTHDMEEADQLCDRIAFLSEGRIVALDTPRELKLRVGSRRLDVTLVDRSLHELPLDDAATAGRLDAWLRAGEVLTVHSQEGTLADVFVAVAGRTLDDAGPGERDSPDVPHRHGVAA